MITRRRVLWLAVATVLIVGTILLAGPGSVSPNDPAGLNGLAGLKRLLAEAGARVRSDIVQPSPDATTFVVPFDLRSPEDETRLLDWARAGGTLVVADPGSVLFQLRGVDVVGELSAFGPVNVRPGCALPLSSGVRSVTIAGNDAVLSAPAQAVSCFARGGGSFALQAFVGRGSVVLLGGLSPFYNRYLASGDDARFAVDLFGTATVEFATATGTTEPRSTGVWASMPLVAKLVIAQLLLATLLFALARGRRLGRPIDEQPTSPIPSGELMRATANLLRESKARDDAISWIRGFTVRRLEGRRLDVPEAEMIPSHANDDDELLAAAAGLERLRRRLEEEQ